MSFLPDYLLRTKEDAGLVPGEYAKEIIAGIKKASTIMQLAKYEQMHEAKKQIHICEGLRAGWVDVEIPTSKVNFKNVTMEAKALRTFVPLSDEYLDCSRKDLIDYIKPSVVEAFATAFDMAVLADEGSPFSQNLWTVTEQNKLEGEITVENLDKLRGTLHQHGHMPSAYIASVRDQIKLENLVRQRGDLSRPLYSMDASQGALEGVPLFSTTDAAKSLEEGTIYAGDFSHMRYGILQNLEYAVSDEATIPDGKNGGGKINLFERDLIAIRVTMHIAFCITKEEAFARLSAC